MKVKELINLLQEQDPDREVILRGDAEVNSFNHIDCIYPGAYEAGEEYVDILTEELINEGFSEVDVNNDALKVVFISPKHWDWSMLLQKTQRGKVSSTGWYQIDK